MTSYAHRSGESVLGTSYTSSVKGDEIFVHNANRIFLSKRCERLDSLKILVQILTSMSKVSSLQHIWDSGDISLKIFEGINQLSSATFPILKLFIPNVCPQILVLSMRKEIVIQKMEISAGAIVLHLNLFDEHFAIIMLGPVARRRSYRVMLSWAVVVFNTDNHSQSNLW